MDNELIFKFKTDISKIDIPEKLNNPFGSYISEIVTIAAKEFQEFITTESPKWEHDFETQRGKMFGILVVQKEDGSYVYLGTISGKLLGNIKCDKFIPSILNDTADDFFNIGMKELSEIGEEIKNSNNKKGIIELTENRKLKSLALQKRLFENYRFSNLLGVDKNVLEIFKSFSQGKPPSAAGDCAAPKLLQYAFKHELKPIALAEFWWGNPPKNKDREHKGFYPSCKSRCRPILEYMLDDRELFIDNASRAFTN